MAKAKDKDTIKDINICQGIRLSKSIYEAKENRLLTLLIKGVIVYLLTMGSIGFYLSAFSIEYNQALCNIVIFVMALFSAMLYYRLLTENAGYMVVLVLFCFLVYKFKAYINSGFYAMVNVTTDGAAQFFNIDIQKIYVEQIEDRYVTVTFAVLFIGIVLDIFLNVYISRRMQYVTAIFAIMGLNMVPLYLIFEPDSIYTVMVLGGIALAYVYRSGKHYSPQVSVKRDDIKFKDKGRKKDKLKEMAYVYDAKAMVNAGIIVMAFIVLLVSVVTAFKPKESFNVGYKVNKYKNLTMTAVSTILMDGLSGFFRNSDAVGGVDHGKLGQVSTIRLDHQTDLVVQMTSYSYDRIYLKGFTGSRYNPYANTWSDMANIKGRDEYVTPEALSLRDNYLDNYEYSSEAIIRIDNVENDTVYRPYYMYEANRDGQFLEMTVYPRLEANKSSTNAEYYTDAAYDEWDLHVPPENVEAIESVINQLDDPLLNEDIIQSVIDLFQEKYPYTIQPGRTPYKEDFVNDFLMEKKKGYCSHYASSAVLIFRYMGIPARYVEGYAIDYDQIINAELLSEYSYQDYFDGYSELGETAMLNIEVTDADAHAWVEVYIANYGWCPVEVTPYATTEEEEQEDFWALFADMMDDSNQSADTNVQAILGENNTLDKFIKGTAYAVVSILVLIILLIASGKALNWIKYLIKFTQADINDRLIFKYQRMCKKRKTKDKEFADKLNYRDQIDYVVEGITDNDIEKSREKVVAILEKAGFSQEIISAEEYEYVVSWCKENI